MAPPLQVSRLVNKGPSGGSMLPRKDQKKALNDKVRQDHP